jgi:hypothetical protein
MDWLGIIRRTAGHSRLTGPWAGAAKRRSLGMVVTACPFFGARCHNHDIPVECLAVPAALAL